MALVALLTLLPGWSRRHCWDPDETRYAWIAQDMLDRGAWFAPQLNGLAYTSKPPPFFWLVAATSLLTKDVDSASRLVSILAAAATTGCLFAIGRRLLTPRAALFGAAALITMVRPAWTFRQALMDPTVTLASTGAVLLLLRSEDPGATRSSALAWRACAGLITGAGFVVKGPATLLGPLLVGLVRWRRAPGAGAAQGAATLLAAVVPVVTLGALFWSAGALDRGLEVGAPALRHTAGLIDKVNGPLFYLQRVWTDFLPWWPLLPAAGVLAWRSPLDRSLRLLFLWLGAGLLIMSCIPAKRQIYLLPLYPPLALLVGAALAHPRTWATRAPVALLLALEVGLGLFLVAVLPWLLAGWSPDAATLQAAWQVEIRARASASLIGLSTGLGVIVAAGGAIGLVSLRRGGAGAAVRAALVAGVAATIWLGAVAMPLDDARRSSEPIAVELRRAASRRERVACVGYGSWHPSFPLRSGLAVMTVLHSVDELVSFVGTEPATLVLRDRELPAVEAALTPRPVRVDARIAQLEDWTLVVRVDRP